MFLATGKAVITGKYTSFYFTGTPARLKFGRNTTIELTASKTGLLSDMAFSQNPGSIEPSTDDSDNENPSSAIGKFAIKSNNARVLLGTIYLPKGRLFVKSTAPVSDLSAYTVVIAKRLQFCGDPTLVLNSDYSATDVPTPPGIEGQNAKVYLTR